MWSGAHSKKQGLQGGHGVTDHMQFPCPMVPAQGRTLAHVEQLLPQANSPAGILGCERRLRDRAVQAPGRGGQFCRADAPMARPSPRTRGRQQRCTHREAARWLLLCLSRRLLLETCNTGSSSERCLQSTACWGPGDRRAHSHPAWSQGTVGERSTKGQTRAGLL